MKPNICPHCGVDVDVEREVFSRDKLFTGHSCRGAKCGTSQPPPDRKEP